MNKFFVIFFLFNLLSSCVTTQKNNDFPEIETKVGISQNEIKNDIIEKGWNENKKAFTQSYGSDDLDASVLLMEQYEFIDAMDPKYILSLIHI